MNVTAYISHPTCLKHDMGAHHPEQSARIHAIQDQLIKSRLDDLLLKIPSNKASMDPIYAVHEKKHIDWLKSNVPAQNQQFAIDEDTILNHFSFDAATFAAGAGIVAIDGIIENRFQNAFCAVRPPGHHAEKARSMGFSLFNNVAIAAYYAKHKYNINRIAIVDFDVHHGNGTEDIVADDPNILFISSYQSQFYPYPEPDKASENCIHLPMPAGTGSAEFRELYSKHVFPLLHAYKPELLLISAGFDGHHCDPLADWNLIDDDYAWVTKELVNISDTYSSGRVISFLEGGYDLPSLGSSCVAHIRQLMKI